MVISLVEAQDLVTGKCFVYYCTDFVCSNLYLVNRVSVLSCPTAIQSQKSKQRSTLIIN